MGEALAIAGASWVASPIIAGLLKEGFSYLGVDIRTKLKYLETTILPQFQFVIEAAERSSEHKAMLQLWLKELKDAVYEAEDVLDECKYQLLEEKVPDLNTPPELNLLKKFAEKVNTKLSILSPQKIKLRISLKKLEKIAAKAETFYQFYVLLQIRIGNDGQNLRNEGQPKDTTSFTLHKVFGREKELGEIIKYLLDPSEASEPEKNYSVGTIVGIGGAGKTTLAQLVYDDKRVTAHFDVKMWVCISRKLDLAKHTKDMIESSGKSGRPKVESREAIQRKLVELVKSNKILLVLDDVWFGRSTGSTEEEWQTLVAPLAKSVKSGSKVLVTTRTKILPVALRPRYTMELKDLEENHILSLFKHHAFCGIKLDDSHLEKKLMTIGKQIVQKLHRSPLAAKAVGCQLSDTLNVGAWKAALEGDNLQDSHQALLWSYQRLDAPLQRCFSYFSLFPKGHKYKAEKMVHLWIAEGFINSSNNSKRMEDIGMEYIGQLVSGSFLQRDEKYEEYYYMHDLFHDLAENVSKEDCLRIEDGDQEKEIPPTIRRLSIRGDQEKENNISINKLENLHTLMIEAGSLSSHATANLLTATEKYKKLRVLMIGDEVSRGALTKLMANLKHLRFLSFRLNEKGEIPAAVGKLYHLQVLNLPFNASLPRSANNLINLRHFKGYDDEALASLPDIGRLTSLQKLERFVVKKEKGHDIGQLKNLNELRKSLTISNLENVEGKDKALEANLEAKSHLKSLHLDWDSNDESEYKRDLDIEVLEGLQPHPNLIDLAIEGYKSPRFPSWLLQEGCLRNLRYLMLQHCAALEVLPSLPQSLEELKIRNCTISECPILEVKRLLPSSLQIMILDHCNITDGALSQSLQGLTSLKSFKLNNISALTTLPAEVVLHHLIALTELKIRGCHRLKSLGGLYALPSLEELDIETCPCLELEMVMPLQGERGGSCVLPPSLRSLSIRECTAIKSIVLVAGDGNPPNLATFTVERCPSLASLSLSHQTALTSLTIIYCPLLSSLLLNYLESLGELFLSKCYSISVLPEHLPQSLNNLHISDCVSISFLPEHLPQSLNNLYLSNYRSISSLPEHLPQSLNKLELWDCPNISSLPEHLPQSLNSLELCFCPNISSLPEHLPQSLNSLKLWNCPSISSLPEHLPQSLNNLQLCICPRISSLSEHLPQSLNSLKLWHCPIISSLSEHLPQSLNNLLLHNCGISSLPEHLPQSLSTLSLSTCPSSLPEHLPQSLTELHLDNCPSISSLPKHLPQSLKKLDLCNCPSISSLPDHLPQSLIELHLNNCPSISSLPEHLPQSLKAIIIQKCQILEMRCQSPNGEDWPKIAHIPIRRIGGI